MNRVLRFIPLIPLAVVGAVALAVPATPAGAANQPDPRVDVVSFNVLAPLWASPLWYPAGMDPDLLATEFRRPQIVDFLQQQSQTADVVCLQEVALSEWPYLQDALGGDFTGFMARNDRDFWSNWLVPELPWEPNGTAILVRDEAFDNVTFKDFATADGNHIALVKGINQATGQRFRAASVHLDSDSNANRLNELRALNAEWGKGKQSTDVICGDINEDTIIGSASGIFDRAGFVDVLATIGNREPTHPWSSSYNGNVRWGIIDHILVRNGTPKSGDVIDSGVWSIDDEVARIEANFRRIGSDHFPIEGSFTIASP